jgi:hypothetical protein
MAKAFDTVRHDFVEHVYDFFGLGPWLKKALNTLSFNRTVAILLQSGSVSEEITLGTGFPQGNPPSPNQFNMCQQILIFKLELDPNIKKIFESVATLDAALPRELPVSVWNVDPALEIVPVPALAAVPVPVPGTKATF